MDWKHEYELGIPVLDAQHKQLFRFNEEVQSAIKGGLKVSSVNSLLTQVKQYAARHFTMEEKYMADVDYPKLHKQKDAHAMFSAHFDAIQTEFNKQGISPELADKISKELIEWITNHITGMDQDFGDYYRHINADTT